MRKKKKSNNIILIIAFFIFVIIIFYLINNYNNKENKSQNNNIDNDAKTSQIDEEIHVKTENVNSENNNEKKENIEENKIEKNLDNKQKQAKTQINENLHEDKKTPEGVNYIELTNEEKIGNCMILGEFENGKNLSPEQYLKVVNNVLNNVYNDQNKKIYSAEEINDIVYFIFNTKLESNKSIDGLVFENGKYIFEKSNSEKNELKNVQIDVAAGTKYIEFEVNNKSYTAKLGTNTITGETYIVSITEE